MPVHDDDVHAKATEAEATLAEKYGSLMTPRREHLERIERERETGDKWVTDGVVHEGGAWSAYVNGTLVAAGPDRAIIDAAYRFHLRSLWRRILDEDDEPEPLLTQDEQDALSVSGELAGLIRRVIGDGPQAHNDWSEAAIHVHALQHLVMAQAAARAYPNHYRLLGQALAKTEPSS